MTRRRVIAADSHRNGARADRGRVMSDAIVIPPNNPALAECTAVDHFGNGRSAWCTRGHEHPMPHVAHGLNGEVLHAWVTVEHGPGNGPRGDECPSWSTAKRDRCGGLMRSTGPKSVPTGETGTRWACGSCGYDVTVYRAKS